MATLEPESVDAIVTDPPYGLSFMGKDWDHGVPGEHFWREALRLAKPGAHLLAFGGTRTFHRLACAIEDAGWEIRDCLGWLYGSGFPKSLDVSKAIDKAAGAQREVVGKSQHSSNRNSNLGYGSNLPDEGERFLTAPSTPAAQLWQGWGTALKPAWEPVILARKPLAGTVAANVLAHGTGALNIDGCRVGTEQAWSYPNGPKGNTDTSTIYGGGKGLPRRDEPLDGPLGRWPANVLHDGSQEVLELFPETKSGKWNRTKGARPFNNNGEETGYTEWQTLIDSGSAARYFYCPKASKSDRDEGLDGMPVTERRTHGDMAPDVSGTSHNTTGQAPALARNHHATVKPTALMRYFCRLITPPGGIILDPFCGSGSTGKAALLEGFDFIGIDLSPEYIAIAEARIAAVSRQEALALA